jgi:hypothetical protein
MRQAAEKLVKAKIPSLEKSREYKILGDPI